MAFRKIKPSRLPRTLLGELKLNDDTILALGPSARLVLDKFVYDPTKGSQSIAVRLTQGAFRFITGSATKRAYKISTPSAVLAIRGTVFDVYIAPNGVEWLLLHEGSLEVCNTRGDCRLLKDQCDVMRLSPSGGIGNPGALRTSFGDDNVAFEDAFPFVENPPFAADAVLHTRQQIEQNQCPRPYDLRPQRADFLPPQTIGPLPPSAPAPPSLISAIPSIGIAIGAAVEITSDNDRPASD